MHVIRLRSAWRIADGKASRLFHRPTGIDGGERVWIAWDGPAIDATLNDTPLDDFPCCGPTRYDVTERLDPANLLSMATDNDAVLQSVRIEIEEPSTDGTCGV